MENAISLNLTPFQALLNLAFMTWVFIIFPVIVIRKLNYLTNLIQNQSGSDKETT